MNIICKIYFIFLLLILLLLIVINFCANSGQHHDRNDGTANHEEITKDRYYRE